MHVAGVFCDLAKAFDCINREILLTKLHFYSIQGSAANWFIPYVTDRRQKVEIKSSNNTKNFCLNQGMIKHEVCQRLIVEPLQLII
jgi:hypothetical protein